MAPLVVALLILLTKYGASGREYDGWTSFYEEEPMREMQRARQCLPPFVSQIMDSALYQMNAVEHHRYLTTCTLLKLRMELSAGMPLCRALPVALKRMLSRHQNRIKQREAMRVYAESGDGWSETTQRIKETITNAESLCMREPVEARQIDKKKVIDCMRRDVEKKAVIKMILHHLGSAG
jgi:hypothetical protein